MNDSIIENNITEQRHAGFWIRAGAFFIDCIIVGLVQLAVDLIINLIVKGDLIFSSNNNSNFYLSVIYYVVLTKSYGQTLGKKWLGIKVIRIDGKPLTYWGVFLREVIGKIISTLILGIGYFMAAFRKDKRALHDLAAKTIVVHK